MYRLASRYLVYPAYQGLTGRRITPRLRFLRESQHWSRERLDGYRWSRMQDLLQQVYKQNPFHRARFEKAGVRPEEIRSFEDVTRLPTLTKEDILGQPEALITNGYRPQDLHKDMTSGSTGKNLIFYIDKPCLDTRTAAVLRNSEWYGLQPGDLRFKLWGAPLGLPLGKRLYASLRDALLRERLVSSYELEPVALQRLVDRIRRQRPRFLIGYVSALEVLARFIQTQGLDDVQLPTIITAGETLFEHQRAMIESALHGNVFNRYGSHEFTGIAHECEVHEGMHINAENLHVEILDGGEPATPGQLGEIVITDLENRGAPFIRYRTEDLGTLLDEPCPCGRGLPRLGRVEGRVYDIIKCPNGAVHTGTFFCKLTRGVPGIRRFQVIQEALDRIRFKMVTDSTYDQRGEAFIRENVRKHCGEMQVDLQYVPEIEPLPSGKLRYVVSLEESDPG